MSRNMYGGPGGQEKAEFYVVIGVGVALILLVLKLLGIW